MKPSTIAWTDFSGGPLNFITGCTPVSPGCAHCYARRIYERFGKDFSEVVWHWDKLERLMSTRFPAYSPKRGEPHRPMAFVCDTGDVFHPNVPDWFLVNAFGLFQARRDVTWQVLTKRPRQMCGFCRYWLGDGEAFEAENVWLGVSVEDQKTAKKRIPLLLQTPAIVRFLSFEPLLGPMDTDRLAEWLRAGIDWVIVGAESGPHRRPFDVAWAREIYDVCRATDTAFFGKQASGLYPGVPLELPPGLGVVQQWPT